MTTDNIFIPKQGRLSDLRSWIAGELGAALVRIYVNNVVYTADRVPSDYVEASFSGYAPAGPLAWGAPFINGADKAETDSPAVNFTYTAGSGTATTFGIYITDPSQTVLLAVIPFVSPFVFSPAQANLSKVIQLTATSEL